MIPEYELPHMGGVTIANKVTARLIEELQTGEFSQCDRLPSEVELAAQFKVSRSVIRDALSNLERECMIERVRGLGTIIHRDIVNFANRLDLKTEYNDLIRALGFRPSVDNVRLYEETAGEELAEKLSLDVGAPLIVCEKRILANGKPVIYSIDHLSTSLFTGIMWQQLDWSQPVFDLLEKHCGIGVDTDIARLEAVMGPAPIRERLLLGPEDALLMMDEIGCYKLSKPIFHTYAFYTGFFDFTLLRRKF